MEHKRMRKKVICIVYTQQRGAWKQEGNGVNDISGLAGLEVR